MATAPLWFDVRTIPSLGSTGTFRRPVRAFTVTASGVVVVSPAEATLSRTAGWASSMMARMLSLRWGLPAWAGEADARLRYICVRQGFRWTLADYGVGLTNTCRGLKVGPCTRRRMYADSVSAVG